MFSPDFVPRFAARWDLSPAHGAGKGLFSPAAEDEGAIGAAESKRIRERDVDLGFARLIWNVVQVALWIWIVEVSSRWKHLVT